MCLEIYLNTKAHIIDLPKLNNKKMYYVRNLFTNKFILEYENIQEVVKLEDLTSREIAYLEAYIIKLQVRCLQ